MKTKTKPPQPWDEARAEAPTEALYEDLDNGPLPMCWRVWAKMPVYLEDPYPWKCIGAFRYLTCALDYIASCQDNGCEVVFQSPRDCRTYKPTDRRVVYRPTTQTQGV